MPASFGSRQRPYLDGKVLKAKQECAVFDLQLYFHSIDILTYYSSYTGGTAVDSYSTIFLSGPVLKLFRET